MLATEGKIDEIGRRAVEQLIADGVCRSADYRSECPSTNSRALADLRSDAASEIRCPRLYLTDRQSLGRGRHGRSWVSTSRSLTFSLVIASEQADEKTPWSKLISLAVGVGVARCLEFEFAPLHAQLKWPNDVYIDGGKVAGVLLEATPTAKNRLVIGIGLNVGDSPALVGELSRPVRSVSEVVGRDVPRYDLLHPLVTSVVGAIADFDALANDLIDEFRSRCLLSGQVVEFEQDRRRCEGLCKGISDEGGLIVDVGAETRLLESGNVDLVRVQSNKKEQDV